MTINLISGRSLSSEFKKSPDCCNLFYISRWLKFALAVAILSMFAANTSAQGKNYVVRLAKLMIDSTQIENYKTALLEEIDASIRVEKGVISLYAVSDKNHPSQITIFEIYENQDAYNSHRETPHFKKYKSITKDMVKSLELIEAVPIMLGSKNK
jgi:quinol monooxygenase YgiN